MSQAYLFIYLKHKSLWNAYKTEKNDTS